MPQAYLERMQRLLGDEFSPFLESYRQPPVTGLRVNTLKLSPEQFRLIAPFELSPVPWCASGFVISGEVQAGRHPYHAAGLYYLQDSSAMAAVEILDPRPGERVLDLAAAPGGKATHIATKMENQGLFVANEIHPRRVWELSENLERWGVRNAVITNESPQRLADHLEGFFDKVLLDAPCSGEGMFRKSQPARQEWSREVVLSCAARQSGILPQAARLVRPGGRLVYATCTFAPEENEAVVAGFLEAYPHFSLEAIQLQPGFSPGRPDWLPGSERWPELSEAVRIWPHIAAGEGHFVAVIQRKHLGKTRQPKPWQHTGVSASAAGFFNEFINRNLNWIVEKKSLRLVGSYLYQVPPGSPDLGRLRVIHPGWWLGTLRKNRFEPSHALALALRKEDARHVLDLQAADERLLAYLRGESIRLDLVWESPECWVLVCVDGFSLGWGRWVKGVLKNAYPKGLRWI